MVKKFAQSKHMQKRQSLDSSPDSPGFATSTSHTCLTGVSDFTRPQRMLLFFLKNLPPPIPDAQDKTPESPSLDSLFLTPHPPSCKPTAKIHPKPGGFSEAALPPPLSLSLIRTRQLPPRQHLPRQFPQMTATLSF